MILPTRKLILLLAVPAVALMVAPSSTMIAVAIAYNLGLLGLIGLDLTLSPRPADITLDRHVPAQASLDAKNRFGWTIANASRAPLVFRITDDLPESMETDALPLAGRLLPNARTDLHYTVRPRQRGRFIVGTIHLRYRTTLGLLVRQLRRQREDPVKVYPNVASLAKYELAARHHRLSELGLVTSRQRGRGGIFESLRDYVPGDDLGDISWKATARRGRLMVRNFESERSQNIVLVLDCGRMMSVQVDGLSRLDHAINSAILLTHVAVKQGDYVGMLAFSEQVESYTPLRKGRAAVRLMNESMYRLEPKLREPNYERACRFLALQQRKRSLVIIFTDVIDPEASGMLLSYTARFARYHLPLCVALRNLDLEAMAGEYPASQADASRAALARQMLDRRQAALTRMRRSGVDVLDADPRSLTAPLIERYLTLKQRHQL